MKAEKSKEEAEELSPQEIVKQKDKEIATLRKQLSQMQEECSLHEKLNDASIDRILAFDSSLNIIAWNKTSELITGIPGEEVLGENLFKVFPDLQNCKETKAAIENALKGFKTFVPAGRQEQEGGYYENHYIPLKEKDQVIGVLNIKHDVAHRIKTENELKALNKALVRKNKELKQRNADLASFTHIASHDLKEPVRKIYTFAEMITNKEGANLTDVAKKYFKRIQVSAQRMGMLTDDILTYSQLNAEEQQWQDVDLNHVLALATDNLSDKVAAKDATIDASSLPAVKGYRNMLVQLFQHILSNALKFHAEGVQPHITIAAEPVDGRDIRHTDALPEVSYIRISFRDKGIGFEKKYSDKIFQMFQRLHNTETYPGTGMGLALCKKIAEMHHGFITADGTPGEGSTFSLYLQKNS